MRNNFSKIIVLLLTTSASADEKTFNSNEIKPDISGYVHWDISHFDGLYNNGTTATETFLRRGRLTARGTLSDTFSYKLMTNYNNDRREVELLDAYLRYRANQYVDITVGRFKEPFGMEALTSANWVQTIERAAILSGPRPIRASLFIDAGLMLSHANSDRTWAVAIVNDGKNSTDDSDLFGITGRFTYSPINLGQQVLHFGIAHAQRHMSEPTDLELAEALSVNIANDTVFFEGQADKLAQTGLEFAYQYQQFALQSEYIYSKPSAIEQQLDTSIASYYITGGYFLSGSHRSYKNGILGKPKLKSGGDIELVAKYERNTVSPYDQAQKQAKTIILGVNIYANKHVKISTNYIKSTTSRFDEFGSGEAISARLQFVF